MAARRRQPRAAGGEASAGDAPRPDAESLALRLLARRPLCRQELRERLLEDGSAAAEIDDALDRLEADGVIDDLKLSLHYIVARANRLGLGRTRMLAELERRGVDPEDARAAWARAVREGHVDPDALARKAAAKRIGGAGAIDPGRYRRVYNALLRAGFDPTAIRAALDAHRPGLGVPAFGPSERIDDDVP